MVTLGDLETAGQNRGAPAYFISLVQLRALNAYNYGDTYSIGASDHIELPYNEGAIEASISLGRTASNKLLVRSSNAGNDPTPLTLYAL